MLILEMLATCNAEHFGKADSLQFVHAHAMVALDLEPRLQTRTMMSSMRGTSAGTPPEADI